MSPNEISQLCDKYNIENYSINKDGLVDVDGSVFLNSRNLHILPLKFGKIKTYFDCSNNHLTSLSGSPTEVGDSFYCHNNKLITLVSGPKIVKAGYWCQNNKLKDVSGFPENFDGDYRIQIRNNPVNEIIELVNSEHIPKFIKYLNDHNVIQGNKIFELGLEEAYYMSTKKQLPPDKREFKYYTLI